jgi:hypothetical protein
MPISSGIMFLMYSFDRLVVLVYIRNTLRHRGGAKRRVEAWLVEAPTLDRSRWRRARMSCRILFEELCPPHRVQTWSHHPRSRATQRGRKAKAAPKGESKARPLPNLTPPPLNVVNAPCSVFKAQEWG